ncbi:transcriptional regulator [Hydrogenophaga sp. Root209]|uniref:transcriptional regulator GcvA n=1 Tax=Hydrogenophaga sp. Root209 TaxID=1736490 RepID=UPI000700F452|nr:transcriptional regulator GcvA [Hydrogenophaga sp. Root209]KRC04567.1 transcriptional regulator [Hydrogenophaga sp. Root209]
MDRLPPLNAVRAFEAVARHLSMSLAAAELHVTPGAISRQVQLLESHLGVSLLKRGHRQVSLTRQGSDFFRASAKAIELIRSAGLRVKRGRRAQLKIRAYTTFSMKWLIPRLSGFHAAHPDVEVLLTTSLDPVDFKRDDLDGAIRLGDGKWPDVTAHRLVANILTPVASPKLIKAGPPLRKPEDLAAHTLLHSIARPDDWAVWLEDAGVIEHLDPHAGMTYESSAIAYAAAVEGQGLAMAQLFLVEPELATGKLKRPFKHTLDMGDFTYYLITPRARPESVHMQQFRLWLLEHLGAVAAP